MTYEEMVETGIVLRDTTNKYRELCKAFVVDQSIDVWTRWSFFEEYAIKNHFDWYIYHNKALEFVKVGSENLHEYFYGDGDTPRHSVVDCVEQYHQFIENFESLPDEVWSEQGDFWINVGKHWGDSQSFTTYNGVTITITKVQLEAIFEQQMKDYVHSFTFDW